jgi:hypothetical protein
MFATTMPAAFEADSDVDVDDFVSNDAGSHDFRRLRTQKKERLINSLQKTNRPLLSTHGGVESYLPRFF